MLRTIFLWIHVVCGALWVAVSLSFMLAAGASTETERAGFTARVAPVLNRVNLAALAILPLSGIANLVFVAPLLRHTALIVVVKPPPRRWHMRGNTGTSFKRSTT